MLHRRDRVADRIHILLAAIGLHLRDRLGLSLGPAQIDRVFELVELGGRVLFQRCEARLLRRIVDRQALQRLQPRPNLLRRRVVRSEVDLSIGQQVAALSGFSVLYRGKDVLECGHGVAAADDESAIRFQGLEIDIGDCAGRHEKERGGGQAQPDYRVGARSRRR